MPSISLFVYFQFVRISIHVYLYGFQNKEASNVTTRFGFFLMKISADYSKILDKIKQKKIATRTFIGVA